MINKVCSNSLTINKIDKWKITTLTYNINGQRSTQNIIDEWLSGEEDIPTSEIEVPYTELLWKASNMLTWYGLLCRWLNNKRFVLVSKSYLATNLLLIFFKEKNLHLIKKIETRWSRKTFTGHKGTISNCIQLKNNSTIVFLTSHFIHGDNNTNLRIEQYKQSTFCLFDDFFFANKLVIWLGDFNFRISGCSNSPNSLIDKIIKYDYDLSVISALVNNFDQLLKCKRKGLIFDGFDEPKITFKPTYRILVGNGNYDSLRMPSWCDRVLYKINNKDALDILRYDSSVRVISSDHFPVTAVFQLQMPTELNLENQKWDCYFENSQTWLTEIPFVCRFRLNTYFWKNIGSYSDWIGIYPEFITSIDTPIQWVYLITSYNDISKQTTTPYLEQNLTISQTQNSMTNESLKTDNTFMVVEFLNLEKGRYKLGYFSKQRNFLCGLSDVFVVNNII